MAAGSDKVAVEFLVEPFVEGRPGNHVQAAIEAFVSRGLSVEIGPFSSRSVGETAILGAAVEALIADSLAAGATAIHIQVGSSDSDFPVGTLHDALAGMLRTTEQLLGTPPDEWSREESRLRFGCSTNAARFCSAARSTRWHEPWASPESRSTTT